MNLISLIGEQAAPNLLPARRLGPQVAVLVHTTRTEGMARNLRALLPAQCACELCCVDPYRIPEIHDDLAELIANRLPEGQVVYNLTGGTKPMVLAAYRLAQEHDSPFVYFQTEGNRSCLYHYCFGEAAVRLERVEELPETLSLDDYLRVYLGSYQSGPPRNPMEQRVFEALDSTPGVDEVLTSMRPEGLGALEIDLAIRCGNQVGVAEVKSKADKAAIDQINAVAHPRYLGTYVGKFLISSQPVHHNNRALAAAYRIEVIELPSLAQTGILDSADREELGDAVLRRMGVRR